MPIIENKPNNTGGPSGPSSIISAVDPPPTFVNQWAQSASAPAKRMQMPSEDQGMPVNEPHDNSQLVQPHQLGTWKVIPKGSRKGNDILYDPEGCTYSPHHSRLNTWQCSKQLPNGNRCLKKVVAKPNEQGDVDYQYDPNTNHGKHKPEKVQKRKPDASSSGPRREQSKRKK